ncbi:MAG: hypothetical protein ACXWC6_15590, partial [Ramlibacter sp.]
MSKTLTLAAAVSARPLSATALHLVAAALRSAADLVQALALRLGTVQDVAAAAPPIETVEFHRLHGDAGAPEGALYINGVLVARIPGVDRL